jgi:two-component system response regulator RegX3
MVALPPPSLDPAARPARLAAPGRAEWLVLANEGPAAELPGLAGARAIEVTGDPRRFRDILLVERPRIVVVCEPPASSEDLELVATQRRRRSRLRALHIAAPDGIERRIAALAKGFDDAVTTATTSRELAARLAWLETRDARRTASRGCLPVAEGFELDLVAHVLRHDGDEVHLRPKEFGLLAQLASRPGRVHTREELLERVWGRDHASGARTVDVHVRWLRSKLEPDPERPVHLVTVRGMGYRLDPPER